AVGSGLDQTAIGANNGSLRSGSTNAAAYASFQPAKNVFFDALVGQANGTFDGSRFDGNASSFMTSHRTGTGTFESLVAGLEYRNGRFEYSPYVRADSFSSRFGAASDDGASPWSLSYAPMAASNTTFIAGLRGSFDMKTPLGTVTPLARIELRDLSLGSQSQGLQYKDGLGPSYSMFAPASAQSGLSGSFGLRVSPNEHFVFQLDYDFEYINGILGMHTVRPELNLRF
ncbi:MAG TPA: autotransporter outer membrane beta-barrel domain-containing protein, partial [Candidatus Baltobacteraceae bacterium]|nr:autotransporter outer membrane beta-barrel domain-containing protein [Candidatus Baltobacteraceae bacterium]